MTIQVNTRHLYCCPSSCIQSRSLKCCVLVPLFGFLLIVHRKDKWFDFELFLLSITQTQKLGWICFRNRCLSLTYSNPGLGISFRNCSQDFGWHYLVVGYAVHRETHFNSTLLQMMAFRGFCYLMAGQLLSD